MCLSQIENTQTPTWIRVDMLRLISLMRYWDKKMVFDVYGNDVEGLEQDAMKILA